MKRIMLITFAVFIAACAPKKNTVAEKHTDATAATKSGTPTGKNTTTATRTETVGSPKTVKGIITEILQEKDGYTAKIMAGDNNSYSVTIIKANLTDPTQYRTHKIGDEIKATGEFWKKNDEKGITARQLR